MGVNTSFAQSQSSANIIPILKLLLLDELTTQKMWIRFTSIDKTATLYYGNDNTMIHLINCDDNDPCDESLVARTAIHIWLEDRRYDLDDDHTLRLELNTGLGDGLFKLNYYVGSTDNLEGTKSWFCVASIINNCQA